MADQQTFEQKPETDRGPSQPHKPESYITPQPRRRRLLILLGIIAILTGGYAAWRKFLTKPEIPPNVVFVSGRIEGDESAVAPKTSGRILELSVREGDRISGGDVIARLDDEQIRAREQQAEAQVAQAEARVRAAQQQIEMLEEQLRQSEIQTAQSKVESQGRVSQAQAELAAAESELARQQAASELAEYDRKAYGQLAQTGAASERQAREAATNAATQAAAVAAAKRRVEAARGALVFAQASLSNPGIRAAQTAAIQRQIGQARAEVASSQADTARARAMLEESKANRADLLVRAPFTGTIATRAAEPGEVVTGGTTIVTLIDLGQVYLRGFVPEGEIGKVKLQQPARVYLDSDPNKPLDAYVSRIDPQAAFTPENTYFRDDRVKQVVGVKLHLKQGTGYAKPGMPADGEILVADNWPSNERVVK